MKNRKRLEGVDERLAAFVTEVDKRLSDLWPNSEVHVLEGKRTIERQRRLKARGASKTLSSEHLEGRAVDMAPSPIRWPDQMPKGAARDKEYLRWGVFVGVASQAAADLGLEIRGGWDWDQDGDNRDQSFDDLVHWELA